MPTSRPSGRGDDGALARRRTAFRLDADADAGGTVPDLALDALGTREAPLLAAALLDRPDQAGLDGRGRGVDVVAVEAQARLEPQRIARAETDGLHLRIGEQGVPELGRIRRVAGDLETVLARIAGTGDVAPDAVDLHIGGHHERHIGSLGCKLCEHGGGGRSLQRHQRQSVLADSGKRPSAVAPGYGRSRRPSWRRSPRGRASPRGRERRRG